MRAAYEQERESLASAAGRTGGALSLLFVYRGKKGATSGRFRFESVREDMSSICRKICAASGNERA